MTPLLCLVEDGLVLLPVLLPVLSLEEEEEEEEENAEDDEVKDAEEEDLDDVACSLALLRVALVVEFVPDRVVFAMLPVPTVEFGLEPVTVALPEESAAPVELPLDLDPEATAGVTTPLFEPEEAVEEGEEVVAERVKEVVAEVDARAATALVGQVEHPPKSWSMPE